MHFLLREWSSDKFSATVSTLSVYFPHITRSFHLHSTVLCLTNVNLNDPLTRFYGFCKVTVAEKACTVITRFDISHSCTKNPKSTAISDVKCLYFVIVYLCIPVAGFDAIFDWYLSMLERFFYLHIVKSTPYNQSCKRLGFLVFILTFTSHFTF